jgi:hypothetical protein
LLYFCYKPGLICQILRIERTKKQKNTKRLKLYLMDIFEIRSYIEETEKNSLLYEEKNFDDRMEALDFLEFRVMDQDQVEEPLQNTIHPNQLIQLKNRAEKLKSELEEIDLNLFKKLRENIRAKKYTGEDFKNLVKEYVDFDLGDSKHQQEAGYDNLDVFINGLFPFQSIPEQTKDLEPEMVYYQKTPARIVFELVEKTHFSEKDVFFDLGSGLGQAAILVNLLTGVTVRGIEFEPAFCDYARDCVEGLNLPDVKFINTDARNADYSEGTVFFMYTPFSGKILQEVLDMLRKEALLRKIRIITYGPCTAQVTLQNWLHPEGTKDDNLYKLAIFSSL